MAKIKSRKKLIAITTAALLVAGGGSAAFAYWTAAGEGTGSAATGTTEAFVVAATTTVGNPLTPGGAAQTHNFTVTNPGTGLQQLTSVVVSVDPKWVGVTSTTSSDTCDAGDYTVSAATIAKGEIAAGGKVTGSFTVAMNNLSEVQDACKGVTVPLVITAS
ncbi:hypothetical protein [Mycetocola sp. 2940]|uniref:hypothetical protein n=1 Tax=Mycetocola sp. 2940 TaxID=3156452 RepID=UPI003396225A